LFSERGNEEDEEDEEEDEDEEDDEEEDDEDDAEDDDDEEKEEEEGAEEEVDNDAWYCMSATSATLYSDNINPKVFKCFSLLDSSRAMWNSAN
jgi:ABC-type Zn2+ transport system substrate-binding protein/surface adhesin